MHINVIFRVIQLLNRKLKSVNRVKELTSDCAPFWLFKQLIILAMTGCAFICVCNSVLIR